MEIGKETLYILFFNSMNCVCSSSRNSHQVVPNSYSCLIFHRVVQIACSRFHSNQLLVAPHRSPLILPVLLRFAPRASRSRPDAPPPDAPHLSRTPLARSPLPAPGRPPRPTPPPLETSQRRHRCSAPPKRLLLHAIRCPNQWLHDQYLMCLLFLQWDLWFSVAWFIVVLSSPDSLPSLLSVLGLGFWPSFRYEEFILGLPNFRYEEFRCDCSMHCSRIS
jgi:hypothetical protein